MCKKKESNELMHGNLLDQIINAAEGMIVESGHGCTAV